VCVHEFLMAPWKLITGFHAPSPVEINHREKVEKVGTNTERKLQK